MSRPRSERAHDQVLEAAIQLFSERGIDATSIDAIAETSGVSKATIYKHWTDKDALALEALTRAHALEDRLSHDTGDTRADIIALLGRGASERVKELRAKLMPHLISYSARHPEFGKAWRARTLEPTKARLKDLIQNAKDRGEFPADLNSDIATAMLLGPMMYFVVTQKKTPDDIAERVVEMFWKAHGLGGPTRAKSSHAGPFRYPRSDRQAGSPARRSD